MEMFVAGVFLGVLLCIFLAIVNIKLDNGIKSIKIRMKDEKAQILEEDNIIEKMLYENEDQANRE